MATQENTPASEEIESLEYPSMCGQRRIERHALYESDEGDYLEGGHTGQVGVDGPRDQPGGLQSITTQSDPTPSSHEQVNFFFTSCVYLVKIRREMIFGYSSCYLDQYHSLHSIDTNDSKIKNGIKYSCPLVSEYETSSS